MTTGTRPPRGGSGTAGGEGATTTGGLRSVVEQLEGVARTIWAYLPDPQDGTEWVQFDSAVVDLHRALVSLRALEQERHRAGTTRDRWPAGRREGASGRSAPIGPIGPQAATSGIPVDGDRTRPRHRGDGRRPQKSA